MSKAIVLRLVPDKPVTAEVFASYLTSGGKSLIIKAFDVSFSNQTGQPNPIGTAMAVSDVAFILSGGGVVQIPAQTTTIAQHRVAVAVPPLPNPTPADFAWAMQSVATAVILITFPNPEYVDPDIVLELRWGTDLANSNLITSFSIGYNVAVVDVVDPFPPTETSPPSDPTLLVNAFQSFTPIQVGAYVPLVDPATLSFNSTDASVTLPSNGSPPNFASLLKAVQTVVNADPGSAHPADITKLTLAQSRNIAYEISWNRHLNPLPAPPTNPPSTESLESMYTAPTVQADDDARATFQGSLTTYGTTNNATGDVLAKYVFSLSAALASAALSTADTNAQLTFPVIPGPPPNPPPTGTLVDVTVELEN